MKRLTYRVNIGVPEDVILVDYKSTEECLEWKSVLERLAYYEDLEEQGRMLIVPDIPKNKTLYWIWENEIIPVTYKRITSCVVADDGRPHIMCEMVTKKDRTYVQTYRRKLVEHTFKKGDKVYFYADNLGKTVFLTRAEAEEALKRKILKECEAS